MTKIVRAFALSTLLLGCAAPDAELEPSTPGVGEPQSDSAGQESDWLGSSLPDAMTEEPSEGEVPALAACSYRSDFAGSITPGEGCAHDPDAPRERAVRA